MKKGSFLFVLLMGGVFCQTAITTEFFKNFSQNIKKSGNEILEKIKEHPYITGIMITVLAVSFIVLLLKQQQALQELRWGESIRAAKDKHKKQWSEFQNDQNTVKREMRENIDNLVENGVLDLSRTNRTSLIKKNISEECLGNIQKIILPNSLKYMDREFFECNNISFVDFSNANSLYTEFPFDQDGNVKESHGLNYVLTDATVSQMFLNVKRTEALVCQLNDCFFGGQFKDGDWVRPMRSIYTEADLQLWRTEDGRLYFCQGQPGQLRTWLQENKNTLSLCSFVFECATNDIPERCFAFLKNLYKISILGNVQKIGPSAFADCGNLSQVNLSHGCTVLEENAFSSCKKLCQFNFENIQKIGEKAFSDTGLSGKIDAPQVTNLGDSAFSNSGRGNNETTGITEFKAPGIKKIGNGCFSNQKDLRTAIIPEVTQIGNGAFLGCSSLTDVSGPKIEKIGKNAFRNCTHLVNINFPNLQAVEEEGFYNTGINQVSNSQKLIKVGNNAFAKCSNLKQITLPDKLFDISPKLCGESFVELLIPKQCMFKQQCNQNGKSFYRPIPVELSLNKNTLTITQLTEKNEEISNQYISYKTNSPFEKIVLEAQQKEKMLGFVPNTWFSGKEVQVVGNYQAIPKSWKHNDRNLEKVQLSASVTNIGERAFAACHNLKNISAPGVIFMDRECLWWDLGITEVYFPNVEILSKCCLGSLNGQGGDKSFKKLDFPKIKEIDDSVFSYTNVEEMNLSNVETISWKALINAKIQKLILPNHTIEITQVNEKVTLPNHTIEITPVNYLKGSKLFHIKNIKIPSIIQDVQYGNFEISVEEGSNLVIKPVDSETKGREIQMDSIEIRSIKKLTFSGHVPSYFWFLFYNVETIDLTNAEFTKNVLSILPKVKNIVLPKKIVPITSSDRLFFNDSFIQNLEIPSVITVQNSNNEFIVFRVQIDDNVLSFVPCEKDISSKTIQNIRLNSRNINDVTCVKFLNSDLIKEENYPIFRFFLELFNNLQTIEIEPCTDQIYPFAFANCQNLTEVKLANLEEAIKQEAFINCPKLLFVYGESDFYWWFPTFNHSCFQKVFNNLDDIKKSISCRLDNMNYQESWKIIEQLILQYDKRSYESCYSPNFVLKGVSEYVYKNEKDREEFVQGLKTFLTDNENSVFDKNWKTLLNKLEKDKKSLLMTLLKPEAPLFLKYFRSQIGKESQNFIKWGNRLAVAVRMLYGLPWIDVLSGTCDDERIKDVITKLLLNFFEQYIKLPENRIFWNALTTDDVDEVQKIITGGNITNPNFTYKNGNNIHFACVAALSGAVKCFKYFLLNNYLEGFNDKNSELILYAFLGGNTEIIRILGQNITDFKDLVQQNIIKAVIIAALNLDILQWLEDNYWN